MRHRACDCPTRRHRLIRVSASTAVLVLAVVGGMRIGTAVGSADQIARTSTQVCAADNREETCDG